MNEWMNVWINILIIYDLSLDNLFYNEPFTFLYSGKKGPEKVSSDEHPRKGSKIEDLQKLKPVFKENGVVSPGKLWLSSWGWW